jgi:hypothetical protein
MRCSTVRSDEIGHSLGLVHFDFGAGGANNLMTAGALRTIPTSLADIFPDGLLLDSSRLLRSRRS